MSDDEGPAEESEYVVNPDDLRLNNINNTLNTKEQEQLFTRVSGNNQSNSIGTLLRSRSSSAILTKNKSSNNPDILSRRSSERRPTVSPTRSTTTSTSTTIKPEEGPQLKRFASPLDAANNIRSIKRNDPLKRSNQHKITHRQKPEPEITKMEISNPNSKIVTKNRFIVSIGVYIENKNKKW
jgi:hypothetical protein